MADRRAIAPRVSRNRTPGRGTGSIAIDDLDGDGWPDLAAAGWGSNCVSIFPGTGQGHFGPEIRYGTWGTPAFAAVGDIDRDGKPDLAVASDYSRTVSVLLNIGPGAIGAGPDEPAAGLAFRMLAPCPNPTGGASQIRFTLPVTSRVDAAVFGLSGRRIRCLASGLAYPAGNHALLWDGRDETGYEVAGGVYFITLRANGVTRTGKIVRLKE